MKQHLIEHHRAMAALHKRHADSLDDGHEMKTFHSESSRAHAKLYKALEAGPDTMPDVDSETRTGDAGYGLRPADKAREAEEFEKMFEL